MKGVCHVLKVLTNRPIDNFLVPHETLRDLHSAPPAEPCAGGHFLKLIGDEESVQFRGLNFICGVLCARAVPEPECCHPAWNDWRRAVKSANLYGSVLKVTYLSTFAHGPYLSGGSRVEIGFAAEALLDEKSSTDLADFLASLADEVAWDRDKSSIETSGLSREEFLQSRVITRRMPFVPGSQHSDRSLDSVAIISFSDPKRSSELSMLESSSSSVFSQKVSLNSLR